MGLEVSVADGLQTARLGGRLSSDDEISVAGQELLFPWLLNAYPPCNLCVLISSWPIRLPVPVRWHNANCFAPFCGSLCVLDRTSFDVLCPSSSDCCPAVRSLHPTRHIDRHKRYGVDTAEKKRWKKYEK